MRNRKIVKRIASGAIASVLALQGIVPTLTVLADESQPEEPVPVIEIEESEPCDAEDTAYETEQVESAVPEGEEYEEPATEEAPEEIELFIVEQAENAEDYLSKVSGLQGSDTLVIATSDEIDTTNADSAVYYDGTYVLSFSDVEA